MRAVTIRSHGGPEAVRIEDVPAPTAERADEVVVSLLDRPGALAALRRFAIGLAAALSAATLAAAATPIGARGFGVASGPPATLAGPGAGRPGGAGARPCAVG